MTIRHWRQLDWFIVIPAAILSGLGLTAIYNASFYNHDFTDFNKQAVFLAIGLLIMFIFSRLDWRIFRDGPHLVTILYIVCLVSLVGLLLFAKGVHGSRSWYKIGIISIDPIELSKIVLIILLAKYFSLRHVELYRIRHIIFSGLYILAPALLVLLQPEVGSVIVLILIWVGVLLISGIKLRHFLALGVCGLLILSFSWLFLFKDYQKARVITFLSPSIAPLGSGWNQAQARVAIGSGGLWGKGFVNATQVRYGFLPASKTDFIFASIVEMWGLIGAGLLFLCYGFIIWRIIKISLQSQSNFPRLFSVGFVVVLVSQTVINISMNLGLLPIIGVPLALVSYGGSSLLASFLGLGIILSMADR